MNNLYLQHHGVKGQKWGVRRYENPDGTLTNAGKKHYAKVNNAKTAKQLYKYRNELSDEELNKRTERVKNERFLYEASGKKAFDDAMKKVGKTLLYSAIIAGTAYAGKKYFDKHGDEILEKVGAGIQRGMQKAAANTAKQAEKVVTKAADNVAKQAEKTAERVKADARDARIRAARSPQGRAYVNAVNKIIGKK